MRSGLQLEAADKGFIEALPANFRGVMQERSKGDGYYAIAATLNIPLGTVKSRIHRARAQIAAMRAAAEAAAQ